MPKIKDRQEFTVKKQIETEYFIFKPGQAYNFEEGWRPLFDRLLLWKEVMPVLKIDGITVCPTLAQYCIIRPLDKLRPGHYFIYGNHSSFMIATDKVTSTIHGKTRFCTSINGFSEEIKCSTKVLALRLDIMAVIKRNIATIHSLYEPNGPIQHYKKIASKR